MENGYYLPAPAEQLRLHQELEEEKLRHRWMLTDFDSCCKWA